MKKSFLLVPSFLSEANDSISITRSSRASTGSKDSFLLDITTIPIRENCFERFPPSSINRRRHLINGPNSSIFKARMVNIGKVILKETRPGDVELRIIEKEFLIEHKILSRIRYVASVTFLLRHISSDHIDITSQPQTYRPLLWIWSNRYTKFSTFLFSSGTIKCWDDYDKVLRSP